MLMVRSWPQHPRAAGGQVLTASALTRPPGWCSAAGKPRPPRENAAASSLWPPRLHWDCRASSHRRAPALLPAPLPPPRPEQAAHSLIPTPATRSNIFKKNP